MDAALKSEKWSHCRKCWPFLVSVRIFHDVLIGTTCDCQVTVRPVPLSFWNQNGVSETASLQNIALPNTLTLNFKGFIWRSQATLFPEESSFFLLVEVVANDDGVRARRFTCLTSCPLFEGRSASSGPSIKTSSILRSAADRLNRFKIVACIGEPVTSLYWLAGIVVDGFGLFTHL